MVAHLKTSIYRVHREAKSFCTLPVFNSNFLLNSHSMKFNCRAPCFVRLAPQTQGSGRRESREASEVYHLASGIIQLFFRCFPYGRQGWFEGVVARFGCGRDWVNSGKKFGFVPKQGAIFNNLAALVWVRLGSFQG